MIKTFFNEIIVCQNGNKLILIINSFTYFQICTFLLGHTAGYRQSWVAHCKLLLSHSLGALVRCKAVRTGWDMGAFVPLQILTDQ